MCLWTHASLFQPLQEHVWVFQPDSIIERRISIKKPQKVKKKQKRRKEEIRIDTLQQKRVTMHDLTDYQHIYYWWAILLYWY